MCNAYLYADDMKIFTNVIDTGSKIMLQNELDKIAEWSEKQCLEVHQSDFCFRLLVVRQSHGSP